MYKCIQSKYYEIANKILPFIDIKNETIQSLKNSLRMIVRDQNCDIEFFENFIDKICNEDLNYKILYIYWDLFELDTKLSLSLKYENSITYRIKNIDKLKIAFKLLNCYNYSYNYQSNTSSTLSFKDKTYFINPLSTAILFNKDKYILDFLLIQIQNIKHGTIIKYEVNGNRELL